MQIANEHDNHVFDQTTNERNANWNKIRDFFSPTQLAKFLFNDGSLCWWRKAE